MRADLTLTSRLMCCLVLLLVGLAVSGAQPPAKNDPPEEPKKLNEAIGKLVNWYDILPEEGAAALTPLPVIRWRNVVRGQEGEAMMVVWCHNGRPEVMASIYPWQGKMMHEFDSLSRGTKLVALDKDKVVWTPEVAGVKFKEVPKAPRPAKTATERLRQMKAIAESFKGTMTGWRGDNADQKGTMTGWRGDNADQEVLRLLPRPLHRYDLANAKNREPKLLDGALFAYVLGTDPEIAYVLGTDPEIVLALEAVETAEKAEWQYAFVRATSGGLEVQLGDKVVWTATKHPVGRDPKLPHFGLSRPLEK